MADSHLYRYSAFTTSPEGGNPAGVWIGEALPDPATMQRIAAEVGYSETAFLVPQSDSKLTVRYYSPEAEVSFCGHATIAAGVVLGTVQGEDRYLFETAIGEVPVEVERQDGVWVASLTTVEPRYALASDALIDAALAALHWPREDLNMEIPPACAFAGAWHLVLAVQEARRLVALDYDFDALKSVMLDHGLTTTQLIWREHADLYHSRNPFPVGGVVEDPATGAAAAALGGYLRDAGLVSPPVTLTIRQGETMGRPSKLVVDVPVTGGITVTGSAVTLDAV
ncbi:PhzF family phenazine biosynthesis protein [Marinobacter caseinilyticus]|uniref:PhzF family phenazine biosynthesis protein n=1 Tax=Marinobacter caseinilyticus TaxID=2692195 RepID=UPI0014083125|nr:PhzF family phenazine biosynthesis isomerase [Marinobacter caseinilyticus]